MKGASWQVEAHRLMFGRISAPQKDVKKMLLEQAT
jgi:hypothetical protein